MSLGRAQPATVGALLHAARAELFALGSAGIDAEILLCAVLDVGREHCYAHPEAPVDAGAAADFRNLIERRRDGYPAAYLLGRREFWSLEFAVNRYTLIPRPETELLVEVTLKLVRPLPEPVLLELGTGCGAASVALARERPDAHVTATDVCHHALALAERNVRQHRLANVTVQRSDWFAEFDAQRFDVILSNPPYVDETSPILREAPLKHEPRLALDGGREGLEALTRIIAGAGRHLRPGAHLALEHGMDQGQCVRALFAHYGFTDIQTRRDIGGNERVSTGRWA